MDYICRPCNFYTSIYLAIIEQIRLLHLNHSCAFQTRIQFVSFLYFWIFHFNKVCGKQIFCPVSGVPWTSIIFQRQVLIKVNIKFIYNQNHSTKFWHSVQGSSLCWRHFVFCSRLIKRTNYSHALWHIDSRGYLFSVTESRRNNMLTNHCKNFVSIKWQSLQVTLECSTLILTCKTLETNSAHYWISLWKLFVPLRDNILFCLPVEKVMIPWLPYANSEPRQSSEDCLEMAWRWECGEIKTAGQGRIPEWKDLHRE